MIKPTVPENEAERLAKLYEYQILDTLPEALFDDLTKLASYICGVPIALVSLVDRDRQWFKSRHGLEATETPRELAFCAHAIHKNELLYVPDSRLDDRFHDNPLVIGAPNVVFYAGAPLTSPEGLNVGTLCVIDSKPRSLTEDQLEAIRCLGRQVCSQLEFRLSALREREASRAKSEFLASMSHELRTPLNAIIGYSEMMLEDAEEENAKQRGADLKKIMGSGKHLLGLINQILDLSKVEAGKMEAHLDSIDLRSIMDEVLNLTRPMAEKNGNELEVDTSPISEFITTDPEKYKQIIINLVSNAAKFTDKGKITIRVQKQENQWVTEVEDTGVGISHEDQKKVFEKFSQADQGAARVAGGIGLGLSICRSFAELLGGNLTLESVEGKGSIFRLELPVDQSITKAA